MTEQAEFLLPESEFRANENQIKFARSNFHRELEGKFDFTWNKESMCYENIQTRQAFSMFFRGFQCAWEMD